MRRILLGHLSVGIGLFFLQSCTQFKPNDRAARNSSPVAQAANATSDQKPLIVTETPVSLILSNSKLAAIGGSFTAKISYGGQTATQDFSPSGAQSTLSLANLPAGASGVLTVEIFQGQTLRFIAKKANTALAKTGANNVVVDDCLILPSPWPGTVNEGSCEWNISEVN
jgi:hypothetical protein